MTAREKAKELIGKFNYSYNSELKEYTMYQSIKESKRCALIVAEEMQRFIIKYDNHVPDFKYWEEVIKEINKYGII